MRSAGFRRKKRLGDLLVEVGVITEEQLSTALEMQKNEKKGEKLGNVLIELGVTTDYGGIAAAAWNREYRSLQYPYSG